MKLYELGQTKEFFQRVKVYLTPDMDIMFLDQAKNYLNTKLCALELKPYFSEQLPCVHELHIKGAIQTPVDDIAGARLLWLSNLIKNAKTAHKICFENIGIRPSGNLEYNELLKETLSNARQIKHWVFINGTVAEGFLKRLPPDISLTIKFTWYKKTDLTEARLKKFYLNNKKII